MSKIYGRGKSALLKAPCPPLKSESALATGLILIKVIIPKRGYLICVSDFGERKRMWRICQFVLGLLFQDTDKAPFHSAKETDLQRKLVEAYRLSIRRGLTPSDALAVATALGAMKKGSLWAPDLAERARPASH
jgi:hypothetical protein